VSPDNNSHAGHRERLKARFRTQGLDNFDTHNVLELLLFYSIPQKDTNILAHDLLKYFGSLAHVFDAPYEELIKVKGVSANTATLIKMIPQLCRLYYGEKTVSCSIDNADCDFTTKLANQLIAKFIGETNEVVYLICFDNSMRVLRFDKLCEGVGDSVQILTRKIVEIAVRCNATAVIISHNHPTGKAVASKQDRQTTALLYNTLSSLSIKLLDHIVVARGEYSSMARGGCLAPSDFFTAPRCSSGFADELQYEYEDHFFPDLTEDLSSLLHEITNDYIV